MSTAKTLERVLRITKLNASPAPYNNILRLQELLFEQRKNGSIYDTWLMLQHSPTYTIGKRGSENDFHTGIENIKKTDAEVYSIPRGGETTYHGPGQIVVYPIINLRALKLGPRAFVEGLEDVMIETLGIYGISARGRLKARTGVWVGDRKIGAIGVKISGGVTCHGLALNVAPDLSYFDNIVPCGQPDREVTSISKELKHTHNNNSIDSDELVSKVAEQMVNSIRNIFDYDGIERLPNVLELCDRQLGSSL